MSDPHETLARIRAQADAATEGPWEVGDRYHCQAADMCECAPDRGPLIDTYQHPKWGTMHVHRKDEPWWNEGVLFRKAGGPPGEVARDLATEDAEFIAAARTTVPALVDALEAVLELHAPTPSDIYPHDVCHHPHCTDPTDQMEQSPWPCPTVKAITDALSGRPTANGSGEYLARIHEAALDPDHIAASAKVAPSFTWATDGEDPTNR